MAYTCKTYLRKYIYIYIYTVETDGVRLVYFILAAVYKRVRARRTTEHFYCSKAEAPVQRKCYDVIGRLVTTWKSACDISPETCNTSAAKTIDMSAFNEICSWMKDLLPLTHFPFTQLYHYLVNRKEKTFTKSRWRHSNRSRHTSTLQMASLLMFVHKICIEKIAV